MRCSVLLAVDEWRLALNQTATIKTSAKQMYGLTHSGAPRDAGICLVRHEQKRVHCH